MPLRPAIVLLFASAVVTTFPARANTLKGTAKTVTDGDTFELRANGRTYEIRLAEIDAPERDQPYGNRAAMTLRRLLARNQVAVKYHELDQDKRIIGKVYLLSDAAEEQFGTKYVNWILVRYGFAWQYDDHSDSVKLRKAEATARKNKRGLWNNENPVPPWRWRDETNSGRRSGEKDPDRSRSPP